MKQLNRYVVALKRTAEKKTMDNYILRAPDKRLINVQMSNGELKTIEVGKLTGIFLDTYGK